MENFILNCHRQVNAQLEAFLPTEDGSAERLHGAVRYSVFNGGKRIRPLLCYGAACAVADIDETTTKIASAVEMMHAYSLIHDDLPAMDDDDLRRGKPACHVEYGEGIAILAGDALQSLAFQQLIDIEGLDQPTHLELLRLLIRGGGSSGMVAGQAIDLVSTGSEIDLPKLVEMHRLKTAAMIESSVIMGAVGTAKADEEQLVALRTFGTSIGVAFQIQDDILDLESSTEELGKEQGSDMNGGKTTFTSLLGLEMAKENVTELYNNSIESLEIFGDRADRLRSIANFIVTRNF